MVIDCVCIVDCRKRIVQPAMHGTLMAPTLKQRLAYGKHLRVFGKEDIAVPMRLAALADAHNVWFYF